jgi:hypothetical protein
MMEIAARFLVGLALGVMAMSSYRRASWGEFIIAAIGSVCFLIEGASNA